MSTLFADRFAYPTMDTDAFVETANAHIDAMAKQAKRVGEPFFHALAVYLSQINTQQKNGGPFGALIVEYEGGLDEKGRGIGKPRVIGVGANHVVPGNDPSAHAEMEAYRDAARRKGSSDLHGAVLFTSCECCPMCLSVANGSGIGRISYVNTRRQAEAIGFSDKLQYDMFNLQRSQQMTSIERLGNNTRNDLLAKLGAHGAVVLDKDGNVFAAADADTQRDPTGIASIAVIRAAVRKCAALQKAAGATDPVFCLPEGFTLVCRDIPHPAGLITADWARMLRSRDKADPGNPALDSKTPTPAHIIHISDAVEQMPVMDAQGRSHIRQDAEVTYRQPALPDEARAVRTEQFTGRIVPGVAQEVFAAWQEGTSKGAQVRY